MTDPKVQPTETADQPVTYAETVAELRRIADALESLGTLPPGEGPPWLSLSILLDTAEGADAAALAMIGKPGETTKSGDNWYRVRYGSPKFGQGHLGAQAKVVPPEDADPTGLAYTRADSEPDDPTPVSGGRLGLHTGGPVGTVRDSELVIDETPGESAAIVDSNLRAMGSAGLAPAPIAAHYETGGWKHSGAGGCGVECACGVTFDGFDTLAGAAELLARHIVDEAHLVALLEVQS